MPEAEEMPSFVYEAYAEYHMLKQNILNAYFMALEKKRKLRHAMLTGKNIKRRENEFISAIINLYDVISEKIEYTTFSHKEDKDELQILDSYVDNFNQSISVQDALKYFRILKRFLWDIGLTRTEERKFKPELAVEEEEDE